VYIIQHHTRLCSKYRAFYNVLRDYLL
jgi:hypothetical protein